MLKHNKLLKMIILFQIFDLYLNSAECCGTEKGTIYVFSIKTNLTGCRSSVVMCTKGCFGKKPFFLMPCLFLLVLQLGLKLQNSTCV